MEQWYKYYAVYVGNNILINYYLTKEEAQAEADRRNALNKNIHATVREKYELDPYIC